MNIGNKLLSYLYNLIKPLQAKIFLFFCLIATIITFIKYKSIGVLFIQFVLYYLIIDEIHCKLYGGCIVGSWLVTIIPLLGIIIFILDYLHIFNNIKQYVKKLFTIYDTVTPENKLNFEINKINIPL